jgi:photosystem II stability/assembly factor-like uncharacterized protein
MLTNSLLSIKFIKFKIGGKMRFSLIITIISILFIAINLQASWREQHTGQYELNDIDFPLPQNQIGFAVGLNASCLKTTNGGNDWARLLTTGSGDMRGVSFPTMTTGYIICDSGNVQKTTDGGDLWTRSFTGFNVQFTGIQFLDANVGYIVGQNGIVLRTLDGGNGWGNVPIPLSIAIHDLHFVTTHIGWVVADNGSLFRTNEAGQMWEQCTTDVNERLLGVYGIDGSRGWVVGTNKTVLQFSDSGRTVVPVDIPDIPSSVALFSVMFTDQDHGFISGSAGWFARTTNGGSSWDAYIINPPRNFYAMDFPAGSDTGWICGAEEAILKTSDGGAPAIEESNLESGIIENSFVCAPNPFRSNTIIKFGLPTNSNATIKLYDAKGELVRTLTQNKKGEVSWDGRNEVNQMVKSGVYLAELNHNGNTQRQKLIFMD